ncbi:polysaccharide biosynthesis/export family protein [Planctomicrobium piriforme]|uniref:Polysaccharide biosynthesis/export protein n=1 Tax=Planctomicrobium piriforme TaxID=1576369 RepID=A0A1I3AXH8_9PLAN|nr:polysaccharide biosynthesis/export family protein [Planctomicrobium piriforme]SFH54061.1 Polysaccharide biosynthesis/export protein [Planctomicrobium piriforme]
MSTQAKITSLISARGLQSRQLALAFAACGTWVLLAGNGCTALHPVRGVPAAFLPCEFEGPSRDNKRTIDLSLLVRTPPDQYRVEAGDVLSIYVPRVLGAQSTEVGSVGLEPPINMPSSIEDPPTVGYPIQVRDDNTISLPQIPPLNVGGLTLQGVEDAILKAYTVQHHILNPTEALVMVSLQRPRITRVLVVRQEATTSLTTSGGVGTVNIGTSGKGTARTVTLKAYENDVLHALARAEGVDGLPGLNAENVIYIIRRRPAASFCPPTQQMYSEPTLAPLNSQPIPGMMSPGMPQSSNQNSRRDNGISLVSYEQPAGNPPVQPTYFQQTSQQPFGGYRASGEARPGQQLSGHSAAAVSPPPYRPGPMQPPGPASQPPQQQNIQRTNAVQPAQYQTGPSLALPAQGAGHSWGALPPEPVAPPTIACPDSNLPPVGASPELAWNSMLQGFDPTIDNPNVIRIPVRLAPGEMPHITEESITLHDGDIIFIESRETEVFYTAGLLGGGQYTLPRDYDLGVLEAVSIAEGRTMGGSGVSRSIGGVSALNHDVSNSASRLAILRTLPNGRRITIEIDLRKAMKYQEENIRIQPGDILFLEYTFPEAVCAFTQRYLFEGAMFGVAAGLLTSGGGG